jgi:hypothetical protein
MLPDVVHLRSIEQTECFMCSLKSLIDGPSSTLTRRRKGSKTLVATHPFAILAGGHQCSFDASASDNSEVGDRARIRLDSSSEPFVD